MTTVLQKHSDLPKEIRRILPGKAWNIYMQRYNRVLKATDGCVECAERAGLDEVERRGFELGGDGAYREPKGGCRGCGF